VQGSYGEKIELVRFAIIVLIFDVEKNLAQAITHQQIMPNLEKKNLCP